MKLQSKPYFLILLRMFLLPTTQQNYGMTSFNSAIFFWIYRLMTIVTYRELCKQIAA